MKKHLIANIVVFLALTFLTGCASLSHKGPISTQKIAVISTLGDEFSVFCLGTTAFNMRDFSHQLAEESFSSEFSEYACSILRAKGYDATPKQEWCSYAQTKRSNVFVYERDDVDPALSKLAEQGYTALLLISGYQHNYYDGGRQVAGALHDLGLYSSSMFSLMRRSSLYASIEICLYDVRDSKNRRAATEHKTIPIELTGDWPESFEEIPLKNRQEYLQKLKPLVKDELTPMINEVIGKL